MAVKIPTPRTTRDDRRYPITLGGVDVVYRLRWWPRLSGWYMMLYAADGVTVVSDWHRVCPQARLTYDPTAPGHPPGLIACAGTGDGSRRDDLWDAMEIQYLDGVGV